jgi:lipopolysaccharide export LptBFGC system permease protein LptF
MKLPGESLRAVARRFCSPDTSRRVVDPLIADLQFEYQRAAAGGRMWQARWRRLKGYAAFWQTIALCTSRAAVGRTRSWAAADGHAIGRTLGYSAAIVVGLTLLLALLPLAAVLQRSDVHPSRLSLLYLVPQAVPIALAFGLPLGMLVGLRGRPSTTRIRWSLIGVAFAGAALAFVVCGWVLPETNQAFRLSLFDPPRYLVRGANELTFGELTTRLTALQREGRLDEARLLLYSYHARLAASAAPLIWGIFAVVLASATQRTLVSTTILIVAGIVYIAAATFIIDGRAGLNPPLAMAYVIWLPNVLFALMTVALWVSRRRAAA